MRGYGDATTRRRDDVRREARRKPFYFFTAEDAECAEVFYLFSSPRSLRFL